MYDKNENIILITGGNGGIGKSVVAKFLRKGNRVIIWDVKDTTKEFDEEACLEFMKVDVTDPDQIQKAHDKIKKKYGYVDHIVSMAGVNMKSEIGGMETITLEDIDKSVKLNLNSHIYLVKIMLDLLELSDEKRKTITMISSINAISSYGLPAYSAAKAGIYGFMKAVTKELGDKSIRINTISLGTVPHEGEVTEDNEYFDFHRRNLAIKEFVRPQDVADTIYSLVFRMKSITGQNIILDMGQSV